MNILDELIEWHEEGDSPKAFDSTFLYSVLNWCVLREMTDAQHRALENIALKYRVNGRKPKSFRR